MEKLAAVGKFHGVPPWRQCLFCPDPSGLDDWPPFVDLRLLQHCERLRRLLFAWKNLHSEIGQLLANILIRQRVSYRGIERRNDLLWRALGREDGVPARQIETGRPASSTVGMSGAAAMREFAITAMALIVPARNCGKEFPAMSNIKSICPATRSCIAKSTPVAGLTAVAGGGAEGGNWRRARDFLSRRGRPLVAHHFRYRSAASYPLLGE
jgi:hypothetical protein